MPPVAGLRTALACAAALRRPPGDPERLRAIAAAVAPVAPGDWLAEAEAKALLAAAGVAVPAGRVVADADDAVAVARALGGPVALKASSPALQHKSEAGALALGVVGDDAVRAAHARVVRGRRRRARAGRGDGRAGRRAGVAARRDAVVPALVVGLGGVWTELLGDVGGRAAAGVARARRGGAAVAARRRAADGRARRAPRRPAGARRAGGAAPATSCSTERPDAAGAQPGDRAARRRRGRGRRRPALRSVLARADRPGELDARAHAELAVDAAQVRLDRARAEHELLGDLAVGPPGGDELGDLLLAAR